MTTPFDSAQQDTEAQKVALLRAIAEEGQRGRATFQQTAADAAAQKQAAVADAVRRFQPVGVPESLAAKLRSDAAAPADARLADNAQAQGIFDRDMARLGAANSAYLGQVKAAVPLVQARTQAQVAQIQAQQQDEARKRALELELATMQREQQQAETALSNKRLDVEGRALDNPDLKPKTLAEVKDQREQDRSAAQDVVLGHLSSGASEPTQNAFYEIVSAAGKGGLTKALALVRAGARIQPNDPENGDASLFKYGRLDQKALETWLRRYYQASPAELEAEVARQRPSFGGGSRAGTGF